MAGLKGNKYAGLQLLGGGRGIFLDNKDFICERQVLLTSFNSGGNKDEGAQERDSWQNKGK